MPSQHHFWSRAARDYEAEFINPYLPEIKNPLCGILSRVPGSQTKTVADLGCGIGPLLPFLARRFKKVLAVDFAEGMLARAADRCEDFSNVQFLQRSLTDLSPLSGKLDVAIAVNSLVLPDPGELDRALCGIRASLKRGGRFLAILPGMDGVHYLTMLLLERALKRGMPLDKARKNAAHLADHEHFDFAFSRFLYQGLDQHFWQPFEIGLRLGRAGFTRIRKRRLFLSWKQFGGWKDLEDHPPPWDWFVSAHAV